MKNFKDKFKLLLTNQMSIFSSEKKPEHAQGSEPDSKSINSEDIDGNLDEEVEIV